jgi:4-aminobutyrate aminotransferase-like enzyme
MRRLALRVITKWFSEIALHVVINRIQDAVFREECSTYACGNEIRCAGCSAILYEVEDQDWLECMVARAFDHECEEGQ